MPDSGFGNQQSSPDQSPEQQTENSPPTNNLGGVQPQASNESSENSQSESTIKPASPKKTYRIIILSALLVLVVILAVGSFLLVRHNKNSNGKQDIPLIKYGFDNNPLNGFYPNDASFLGVYPIQTQIFEGLVAFQNGTQIKPQLAADWSNPNDTTWIFHLKPNIYFHDGDQLTAQDVVYTWQKIKSSTQTISSLTTGTINNVQAVNNSTVEITTVHPDPILLNRLALLFIIDSKAPKNTSAWGLGTGAYTVKAGTNPSANNLDLVAFDKWHGGHVYTRELDYIFYADPDKAVSALKSGKVNLINAINQNNLDSDLKNNFHVFNSPQIATNIIAFNTTTANSPAANIKIRQAFNLAVNGSAVLTQAQQEGSPVDQIIPPEVPGYDPGIQTQQQNISEAASLVKQAGYPNGVTLNFGLGEPAAALAPVIASEVKQAGIKLNTEVATDEGQYFNTINSGGYDAWITGVSSYLLDGTDILSLINNPPYINNQTFTDQLNNATTVFTASQHLKDIQAAELTLNQGYYYVPLYQLNDLNVSDKGYVFPLNDYDADLNAYFANVYKQD